ncbi:MAG: DEAD/DEAH box helicase [Chloroflexi bacterium]|nr:DEAD/DEAH box helicase [Chloroflexota bacterium]
MKGHNSGSAVSTATSFRGKRLYSFQQRAIEAIDAGRSVIVAAPTGAGKTLVADYAIEHAFMDGRRIIYTAPIKALSNQKFRDFTARHGERVGAARGDEAAERGARQRDPFEVKHSSTLLRGWVEPKPLQVACQRSPPRTW